MFRNPFFARIEGGVSEGWEEWLGDEWKGRMEKLWEFRETHETEKMTWTYSKGREESEMKGLDHLILKNYDICLFHKL